MNQFKLHLLILILATPTACIAPPTPPNTRPTVGQSSEDIFLQKDPASIRVMTYNVNWDSIFPDDDPQNHDLRAFNRVDAFRRILRATRPDVVCLQEINSSRRARDLGDFLEQALGSSGEDEWQVVNVRDDVIATRFGLMENGFELVSENVMPSLDQAAALIDLPDTEFGASDLYLICSHFKSGGDMGDILLRGRQADVIMAHVRDFETQGGNLDLPAGTPFVILGDFNAYDTDPALHIRTLIQGDIYNERNYGVDLQPDWDGTALEDAIPSHNRQGVYFYTWRNDSEPFKPSALDRVIFSDSVLQLQNAFVLNTTTLSDEALADSGLLREDVLLDLQKGNYDHLPVVVDFRIRRQP